MDKDGEIVLSMAPKWLDEDKSKRNEVIWRMMFLDEEWVSS
jgi:hypothetical protein